MPVEIWLPINNREDLIETIRIGARVYRNYATIKADGSLADALDTSRVSVYSHGHNIIIIPHGHVTAEALRYMRERGKDKVDREVMEYIYRIQDARNKPRHGGS